MAVVVAVALAGLLLGVLAVGWSRDWFAGPAEPMALAAESLPEQTLRMSFTDWLRVTAPGPAQTLGSALVDSADPLRDEYGLDPRLARWEAYGQAREGSVDVLRVADDLDLGELVATLERLGYDAPAGGPDSGGVWAGDADLVSGIAPGLSSLQSNFAVLAEQHLVLMSDSSGYLGEAVAAATGAGGTLAEVAGVADLADQAGQPVSAVLWAEDFACEDLSMAAADPADVEQGEALVAEAGGVSPLAGLLMAQQPDGVLRVSMWFESERQASADLQPRVDLASGPAPGQGGSFGERFEIDDARADGPLVTLRLVPRGAPLLADLAQGPVLFATC